MLDGVKLSTFTTTGQVPIYKDSFSGVSCTDYYLQTRISVETHVDCTAIYVSNIRTRRRCGYSLPPGGNLQNYVA